MVDVTEQQRNRYTVTLCLAPQALELPIEATTVMQPGQAVVVGKQLHQMADQKMLA